MNMKQLLILCDLYPPAFAPRVAYLTQYLRLYGWQPTVFTEEVEQHQVLADFPIPCPIYRVRLRPRARLERAVAFVLEAVGEYKDRSFGHAVQRYMLEHGHARPDAILCLTYRKFPLWSAQWLARYWKIPWLGDCRDLVEQYSGADFLPHPLTCLGIRLSWIERLLARQFIRQRDRSLSSASAVVTVSQWHREVLARRHREVSVIYNGYDHQLFRPEYPACPTFRIVFTGRLLSLGMRDPSLLLRALATPELIDLPLEVHFYTDDLSANLLRSLPGWEEDTRLHLHPMVPSRSVPRLLAQASVILLLGNVERKAGGPNGMVSTKLFEALAMQKPTLLLPDTTGEAAQILVRSGCGIATDRLDRVISFIQTAFVQWQSMGFTVAHEADRLYIQQFSRRRQAQQFAQRLDELQ